MTQLSGLNNQERKSQQHSSDQRSPFWSTERLPALFAGLVMVTFFVAVVSCLRKSGESHAIACIVESDPVAERARRTAAIRLYDTGVDEMAARTSSAADLQHS